MSGKWDALLVLLLALVAGCQQPGQETTQGVDSLAETPLTGPESAAARRRAAAAVASFKELLLKELTTALSEGGPVHAIGVCKVEAPRIAESSTAEGLVMGRTSHRLRNPMNEPRPWVEPLLAGYVGEPGQGEAQIVPLGAGRWGYVEPIRVMSPCLKCHGSQIADPVKRKIAELYPEDQATGFEAGDFRGLFWVEVEAGAPAEG